MTNETQTIETLCERIGEQRSLLYKATSVLDVMSKTQGIDVEAMEDTAAVVSKLIGEINDALDGIESDLRKIG